MNRDINKTTSSVTSAKQPAHFSESASLVSTTSHVTEQLNLWCGQTCWYNVFYAIGAFGNRQFVDIFRVIPMSTERATTRYFHIDL